MYFEHTFTKKLNGQDIEMTAYFDHWINWENPAQPDGEIDIWQLTAKVENAFTGKKEEVDVYSLLGSTLEKEEITKLIMDDIDNWYAPTP